MTASAPGAPLLELVEVSRHFPAGEGVVVALDRVSLTVRQGEYLAIMGQSGCGKTTLMNLIGLLDRPTDGTYRVLGQDVAALDEDELAALRRDVFGFVFQRYNLIATATAAENVELPAIYAGLGRRQRADRAAARLERLGLGDRLEHRPPQLSGGQQQRVSIARALVNDAAVVLADEPTGALDSRSGQEVLALLRQLNAEGRTIILITHDPQVAAEARRVVKLHDGRVVEDSGDTATADAAAGAAEPPRRRLATPDLGEAVKMALRSLRANLFRTVLTLLGIVIGVASVVALLAVGNGTSQQVVDRISAMGTNLLLVRPGAPGVRTSGDNASLTPEDAAAIQALDNVASVAPERSGGATLRYGNRDYATQITGTWPGYVQARDWELAAGSFFTEVDVRGYAPVVVLGQTVARNLFGGDDPVGRYVLVNSIPFEVIGLLAAKGASPMGGDSDDAAFVPLTTGFMRVFGSQYLRTITVEVADVARIDETQAAITALLIERHRTEDFQIRNMASILDTVSETQGTLTLLLGAIAAISLLVGGIGVMNIMLVSVTERTREIGVRKATGARMRDILLQFNAEAVVVCGIGGVLGVGLGLALGTLAEQLGVPVIFAVEPALMAFGCAFLTGLVFGFLPARKAARLDPVVALSSE
ncbi:MAG: MacB family efflux pump subunit [Flavobacteriales bacterium]|nr:MacB family efflux pump subunit [Flavobacteriales bacterium]